MWGGVVGIYSNLDVVQASLRVSHEVEIGCGPQKFYPDCTPLQSAEFSNQETKLRLETIQDVTMRYIELKRCIKTRKNTNFWPNSVIRHAHLHFRSGLTTNELLKMAIPQITFQGVDTRDAQHGGVKQAVDDVEGRNFWYAPGIDEAG